MNGYAKQLFKKDDTRFRKYIENTTAHGVVRIFSGKSIIRRLFWLVIVLGATIGCLYNIIDRIIFLADQPTSTTLSLTRQANLTFPAVTICNLNQYRLEALMGIHPYLGGILRLVHYTDPLDETDTFLCDSTLREFARNESLENLTIEHLQYASRNPAEELIAACFYSGRRCNSSDFVPVLTDSGYCYTFNGRSVDPPLIASSTGTRAGLQVLININQSQYVATNNLDVGVKVVIHRQDEVPRPEDVGLGVPPGTNAFMGVRRRDVIDETKRDCRANTDTSNYNFLGRDYNYSISSCIWDCLLTNIVYECNCTLLSDDDDPSGEDIPTCALPDICCVVEQNRIGADNCDCPAACNTTTYEVLNSYSGFPARYVSEDLSPLSGDIRIEENALLVNVFFETLNTEKQTTSDAYGPVALLSDLGGQLGLFLGISVISIMEFVVWVTDELKTRVFGDKLRERNLCRCCKKPTSEDISADDTELPYVDHGSLDNKH